MCVFVFPFTATLEKRSRLNSVDSGDLDASDDERPSSSMSVEKDLGDEKVDVESPPTPPPTFLPPPPPIIKSEVEDTTPSLVSPLVSAASMMAAAAVGAGAAAAPDLSSRKALSPPPLASAEARPLHEASSIISPAATRPCLPSPTYSTGLPGSLPPPPPGMPGSSLPYPYLYYSHMMSPYLLGRTAPPLPPAPTSALDKAARDMYAGYPTYLRTPPAPPHPSSLPATPSRPAPIHPYSYTLPPQVPAANL